MAQAPLIASRPDWKMGKGERVEIQEIDQANRLVATYIHSPPEISGKEDGKGRIDISIPKNTNTYAKTVLNAFLPAGYPHSVTGDYLEYQVYDSLQAFSSSIAGMLSSRAVLEGIGVGNSAASPTSALLLSVLQESMGRLATILFAHRLGTSLEPECKMYRLSADIFNDAAMLLDCLSPALPKVSRVALLSMSSVLRALCGVAAGSSKASLSAHFAMEGNLGELNAKDSSQETIISLLGMLAGSLLISHLTTKRSTWLTMLFLLAIHLGTNYLAVRAVCMRTLNRQRACLVFEPVLQLMMREEGGEETQGMEGVLQGKIPGLEEIRRKERIFEKDGVLRYRGRVMGWCRMGVDVQSILQSISSLSTSPSSSRHATPTSHPHKTSTTFSSLLSLFAEKPYLIWYDTHTRTVLVVLQEGVTARQQLGAWMLGLGFVVLWEERGFNGQGEFQDRRKNGGEGDVLEVMERVMRRWERWEECVMTGLEDKGWDLEVGALEVRSGTRIRRVVS